MLEHVIGAVVRTLRDAGVKAGPAYPKAAADRRHGFVRVGVAAASDRSAGFGRYLGIEADPEAGEREVYGLRCEIELSLDVYLPPAGENAALECAALFDRAAAAIGGLRALRVRELRCGAPEPDRDTGMFRLSGCVKCAGLLVSAGSGGAEAEFTDFVLRGELQA